MPINCPHCIDICDEVCRYHSQDGYCTWFTPKRLLKDILTPYERIDELEAIIKQMADDRPWSAKQWDYVQQVEAKLLFLEKRLNEYLDAKKRKKGKY